MQLLIEAGLAEVGEPWAADYVPRALFRHRHIPLRSRDLFGRLLAKADNKTGVVWMSAAHIGRELYRYKGKSAARHVREWLAPLGRYGFVLAIFKQTERGPRYGYALWRGPKALRPRDDEWGTGIKAGQYT